MAMCENRKVPKSSIGRKIASTSNNDQVGKNFTEICKHETNSRSSKVAVNNDNNPVGKNSEEICKCEKGSQNRMSTIKPGVCYIFNQEKFYEKAFGDKANDMKRLGSSEDVKQLSKVLASFQIQTEIHTNRTVEQIKRVFKEIEEKDFTQQSYIVVIVLSHGGRDGALYAKDGLYFTDSDVLHPLLTNKTLKDKPKILFIEADRSGTRHLDADSPTKHAAPNETMKFFSTYEGYNSYSTRSGSIFIQSLCKHLETDGLCKDIQDIVGDVVLDVKTAGEARGLIQVPSYVTNLTEPFVFGDYMKETDEGIRVNYPQSEESKTNHKKTHTDKLIMPTMLIDISFVMYIFS